LGGEARSPVHAAQYFAAPVMMVPAVYPVFEPAPSPRRRGTGFSDEVDTPMEVAKEKGKAYEAQPSSSGNRTLMRPCSARRGESKSEPYQYE